MPLSHPRIAEIGSSAADTWCAWLFANLDASVIEIENSHGDLRGAISFAQTDGVAAKSDALCSEPQAFSDQNCNLSGFEGVAREGPIGSDMFLEEQRVGVPKKGAR